MADAKSDKKIVTTNRKAHYDYSIEQTLEAGMVLMGSEIKSIRANHVNLKDGYVVERNGELWLMNVHISPTTKPASSAMTRCSTASCFCTINREPASAP